MSMSVNFSQALKSSLLLISQLENLCDLVV